MKTVFVGTTGHSGFMKSAREIVESGKHDIVFISLDISNFKYINDFYGIDEGDKVIQRIGRYFFEDEPKCLAAYCVGFDQYRGVYDMAGLTKDEMIDYIIHRNEIFKDELSRLYPHVYHHVYTGLYFYDDDTLDVRMAVDRSHLAKKAAKGNFGIKCQVYTENNTKQYMEYMDISNKFIHACEEDRILMYLQPKISYNRKCIVGAEALARVLDDDETVMMPGKFIPVLEDTGMIERLDRIMIRKVFEFQHRCAADNLNTYPISINVSRQLFCSDGFVPYILGLQKEFDVCPSLIELEILESTFVKNMDSIIETINTLRNTGFIISVDDFGSGYSSLSQIASIPADVIKLDRVFATKSLTTKKGQAVTRSIINLLKDVNYEVVFEGIETEEQLRMAVDYNCDIIQGYYYSKPVPSSEFVDRYCMCNVRTGLV